MNRAGAKPSTGSPAARGDRSTSSQPSSRRLARSPICPQAFRLGSTWGLQFHPEVDLAILEGWLADLDRGVPPQARDAAALEAGVAEHLAAWNVFGRELFRRFLTQTG